MAFLPRDPRLAPPGNRTFWQAIWFIEWGIVFALLDTIMGFVALLRYDKPGSEIVLVVGAPVGILTLMGAWSQSVYQKKSISRGAVQPDGREGGAP